MTMAQTEIERAVEDARFVISAFEAVGNVQGEGPQLDNMARALLAEHARAERLAGELSESTDKARAWDKVSEKNARAATLADQVRRMRGALEDLYTFCVREHGICNYEEFVKARAALLESAPVAQQGEGAGPTDRSEDR